MENIDWTQVGAVLVPMLGLGLAGLAYLTRQFNRLDDRLARIEERLGNLEQRVCRLEERMDERFKRKRIKRVDERFDRMDDRFDRIDERLDQLQDEKKSLVEGMQNIEKEQARMLGFLEGRGVMGKAPAAEVIS